jgi:hypothetical protein
LARRFGVHPNTIHRWATRTSPLDKSAPTRSRRVVTPAYEQAVIEYRRLNPHHGPIRIALALQEQFDFAHRGTVALILNEAAWPELSPKGACQTAVEDSSW